MARLQFHSEFVTKALAGLEASGSVLNPRQRALCRRTLEAAKSNPSRRRLAAETLLGALGRSFAREMQESWGATVRRRSFTPHRQKTITVTEISVNKKRFLSPPSEEEVKANSLINVTFIAAGEKTGNVYRLEESRAVDPEDENQDRIIFRLFPPALLLGATHLFFTNPVAIQVSPNGTPLDGMRDLAARETRTLRLSALRSTVHRTKRFHPYPGAIHDLYHIFVLSEALPEFREDLVVFYDAGKVVLPLHLSDPKKRAELLEYLLDGQTSQHRQLFRRLKKEGMTLDALIAFYNELARRLPDNARTHGILKDLRIAMTEA